MNTYKLKTHGIVFQSGESKGWIPKYDNDIIIEAEDYKLDNKIEVTEDNIDELNNLLKKEYKIGEIIELLPTSVKFFINNELIREESVFSHLLLYKNDELIEELYHFMNSSDFNLD